MIILFHGVNILIFQLLRNRKRIKFLQRIEEDKIRLENSSSEHVDLERTIKFYPPVYLDRYARTFQTLMDERWRKQIRTLVDFGCAEFGLFGFIKRLSNLIKITLVDIDEDVLEKRMYRLDPLVTEYLKRRSQPLHVKVLVGNAADPDYRVAPMGAVTALELIEHLYPDVLDAFPYNVFGYIRPCICILTTPNADFNVVFSNNTNRFRHPDHKFEWTREQFEEWATNITVRFPDYSVSFSGIGKGPEGTEHLGQCSQMAVFVRKDILDDDHVLEYGSCLCNSDAPCRGFKDEIKLFCNCVCHFCSPSASYGVCTYYSYSKKFMSCKTTYPFAPCNDYHKCLATIEYPFEKDCRSEEAKMMDEFRYTMNALVRTYHVEERERSEIPLDWLLYAAKDCNITVEELHKLLIKHGYQIEECIIPETGDLKQCVIYIPLVRDSSRSSEASSYDSDTAESQINELNEKSVSDWDEPFDNKDSKPNEWYQSGGNNYIAQDEAYDNVEYYVPDDNLEIVEPFVGVEEDNANIDNYNEGVMYQWDIEDPPVLPQSSFIEELVNVENAENVQQTENLMAKASREVLFDANSEQDLLEDFEIPAPIHEADPVDTDEHDNIQLVGVQLASAPENLETDQATNNGFPDWLLQILGAQAVLEEETPPGSQEGSHFYCQGDGLGVHPSIIAVEVDEEDETTESSNNTADYGETEQGSSQDMTSLPEDSQTNAQENEDEVEAEEEEGTRPTTSEQANPSIPNSDLEWL